MPLRIRKAAACKQDVLALGECMVRLSPPGHGRLEFARSLEVDVGGGEFNVAYGCVRLGLRGAFLSKLPENPIAQIILNHGRAVGMDMSQVVLEPYDGIGRRARVGLNFAEVGIGVRPSVTLYDRGYSAASQMQPEDVNWRQVFAQDGARWFHTGGIFTALSDSAAATVKAALAAADDAGTVTSYDLNFRSKLWSSPEAIAKTLEIMPRVRVLIGNDDAFEKSLGMACRRASAKRYRPSLERSKRLVQKVIQAFPKVEAVGFTLREVKSGLVNNWSALLWFEGRFYASEPFDQLEIEDRVGGGDGFASGLVYGFLTGLPPQEIVDFAAAYGALLHTTRGDTSQVSLAEVRHVMHGGGAGILR